eukprot:scaffold265282_cov36-Tisochrysis_lutea.AAC.2
MAFDDKARARQHHRHCASTRLEATHQCNTTDKACGDHKVEQKPRAEATDNDCASLSEVAKNISSELHNSCNDHPPCCVREDGGPHRECEAVEGRAVLLHVSIVHQECAWPPKSECSLDVEFHDGGHTDNIAAFLYSVH